METNTHDAGVALLGYRLHYLHNEDGLGRALQRDPAHVFTPDQPENSAHCLRCGTHAPVMPIEGQRRALVPIGSRCTFGAVDQVADGHRVVVTVICPECGERHQVGPDGAYLTHRIGRDDEPCTHAEPADVDTLSLTGALLATDADRPLYDSPAAADYRRTADHADRYKRAALAVVEAVGMGDLTGVGIPDLAAAVARLLTCTASRTDRVRAAVAGIITAERCHAAAVEGGHAVVELVDIVCRLAAITVDTIADNRPATAPTAVEGE